jgi:hypothetical protein
MLCSPNLNDTQYQNLSFSSYNAFYYGFFLSATDNLGEVAIPSVEVLSRNPAEGTESDEIMGFVPNYCIGNLCIAGKEFVAEHGQKVDSAAQMHACNSNRLDISQVFGTVNTLSGVVSSHTSRVQDLYRYWNARFLAKWVGSMIQQPTSNVCVEILDWHWYFGLASATSDGVFGVRLVYELVSLAVGQSRDWRTWISMDAVVCAGFLTK